MPEVTGALTGFADAATGRALAAALGLERRRGRLPGESEAGGMVALAMGKMGAGELNYSSDIDLVCLFDETRRLARRLSRARAPGFVRATRRHGGAAQDRTADGYVFRVDLRLRPDAAVTPVCMAMAAAEAYYESLGRTWERAAYIKARPCGGDLAAGDALPRRAAALRLAPAPRLRGDPGRPRHAAAHPRPQGAGRALALDGTNSSSGAAASARSSSSSRPASSSPGAATPRCACAAPSRGSTASSRAGWVPPEDAATLTRHYRRLREVEHRLQMIADQQTHVLPGDAEGWDRLAALMGEDEDELRDDLAACFEGGATR